MEKGRVRHRSEHRTGGRGCRGGKSCRNRSRERETHIHKCWRVRHVDMLRYVFIKMRTAFCFSLNLLLFNILYTFKPVKEAMCHLVTYSLIKSKKTKP